MRSRRAVKLVSLAAVILATGAMTGTANPPEPACVVAQRWVEQNRNHLPTTYEHFSTFDRAHRRAIFVALAPGVRADLWRTHITRFLADTRGLTPEQTAMARRVVDRLPEFMAMKPGDTRLQQLREEILSVYDKTTARKAFAELGAASAAGAPGPGGGGGGPCECSIESDFCDGTSYCDFYAPCDVSAVGCGILQVQICDGMCT